ncbi:nitroreductase [Sulfitobacter sp. SK012]|nr:nitroreductase [Sulfitobacter sp. SK012]
MTNTRAFETQLGSEFATIWARSVLEHYRNFNRAHAIRSDVVDGFLDNSELCSALGGITQLNTERSDEFAEAFRALALSRHSVRQFSDTSVDAKLIHDATLIAAKSPSVCNRQSARLHHITDPDLKQKALEIQGGNRGFGAQIPELLIVTSDLSSFLSSAERYQCWIDGGLFAMSLVYALHSKGLGTCMLNWSVDASRDIALRKHVDIPASENVIVFIAVGHLPKNLTVATSPRRHVEQILTVH